MKDDDVETFLMEDTGDVIMVIWMPAAKREQKPVFINDDLFGGTFRRNWEGDYHCTRLQVKTMLRDQAEETMDMEVLEEAEIEDLNIDSVHGYRNSHKSFKPGHPFERLDDNEYLRAIGAAGFSKGDKTLHPTAAGMLMFGNEYDIVRYFPEYFLRNIGLRRSRGRYMLSGSSDVIMPPHFFLGIQKHLFSKNYLLRTIRILVNENSVAEKISYASLFNSFVKNHYFRNKIVNTVFPNPCSMPCNPRNRDCGDFQGFHRNFWYKMNAYYNGHENYNVDSLLDYHLLGMFTPIM